jgi:sortase A
MRRIVSFLFIAASMVLLYFGAREFLGSRLGQIEARRDFSADVPSADVPSAHVPSIVQPKEQPTGRAPEILAPRPGETIARLTIPRLAADVYIVEGDGDSELRRGPGHLTGSAVPGGPGNCIIAGHRDTHFRVLKNIRKGDDILLETKTGQFLYRVKSTRIVTPDNTAALKPTREPELNLITCYPFYYVGSAPKRFVVEAQLAAAVGT